MEAWSGVSELLIVVPARGGSKRLPGKNLRLLDGEPLLNYTAQAITEAGLGDATCLLSTDNEAIAECGRALGWTVPWLRPAALSDDYAATVDAVLHALDSISRAQTIDFDPIMVLQPTSPLRGSECLIRALELLRTNPTTQAVVGMRALHLPGGLLYATNQDGFIEARSVVGNLVPNGAVYVARAQPLRSLRTLYPPHTMPLVMNETASIDIDTEDDWRFAESLLAAQNKATGLALAQS